MGNALGFIEISGVVAAGDALDIMCKTADVELVTWERKLGGRLVTLIVRGNVSAVTQAVETASAQVRWWSNCMISTLLGKSRKAVGSSRKITGVS